MPASAVEFLPDERTLEALRAAAQGCRGCDLYQHATQVVFGEGRPSAELVMVGEQPGDEEDVTGRPFVGPSGRLLDKALAEAGIDRSKVYVTNAVKHFKFHQRGKRRIHDKPTMYQMKACRPWLEAELAQIEPRVLVLLGATAAQAILGNKFRLTQHHGEVQTSQWAQSTLATIHPSAVLRTKESDDRQAVYDQLVSDLKVAASLL